MALHEVDIWNRALSLLGDLRIELTQNASDLTAATAADPVVVTHGSHGYTTGDLLLLRDVAAMTELEGRVFRITAATTYNLDDEDGTGRTAGTDGTPFLLTDSPQAKAAFDAWTDIRDEVLRCHPWNVAVKTSRLARLDSVQTVASATAASPVVCTTSGAHGYSTGDTVLIEAMDEMIEVNGRYFDITIPSGSTTTFNLNGEDGTTYTAESTGGTCKKALTPLTPDHTYGNIFDVPSDSLRILELRLTFGATTSPWVVEGTKVLTNDGDTVPLRYIQRLLNPASYDPMLAQVMAYRLALELAEDLTQSNTKKEVSQASYDQILAKAKRIDSQEQSPMPRERSVWENARLQSSSRA